MKILKNPKTESYFKLKELVLGSDFSWHWVGESTLNLNSPGFDNFGYYSHIFLERPDKSSRLYPLPKSDHLDLVYRTIIEIVVENNIHPDVIYRINANCTHPTKKNIPSVPHYDHSFKHHNLLIYLNDCNEGHTIIDGKPYYGKEDDVILFEGIHNHEPPIENRRIVIVCTLLLPNKSILNNKRKYTS